MISHANAHPNFVILFMIPLIVERALRLCEGTRVVRDGVVVYDEAYYGFDQTWIQIALLLWFVLLGVVYGLLYPALRKAADAIAFLKANPIDAVQVHMPGGLESPLAVRYGITSLPAMFLIDPDGKVVSRNVAATTIDDELRKLFKVPEKDSKDK